MSILNDSTIMSFKKSHLKVGLKGKVTLFSDISEVRLCHYFAQIMSQKFSLYLIF